MARQMRCSTPFPKQKQHIKKKQLFFFFFNVLCNCLLLTEARERERESCLLLYMASATSFVCQTVARPTCVNLAIAARIINSSRASLVVVKPDCIDIYEVDECPQQKTDDGAPFTAVDAAEKLRRGASCNRLAHMYRYELYVNTKNNDKNNSNADANDNNKEGHRTNKLNDNPLPAMSPSPHAAVCDFAISDTSVQNLQQRQQQRQRHVQDICAVPCVSPWSFGSGRDCILVLFDDASFWLFEFDPSRDSICCVCVCHQPIELYTRFHQRPGSGTKYQAPRVLSTSAAREAHENIVAGEGTRFVLVLFAYSCMLFAYPLQTLRELSHTYIFARRGKLCATVFSSSRTSLLSAPNANDVVVVATTPSAVTPTLALKRKTSDSALLKPAGAGAGATTTTDAFSSLPQFGRDSAPRHRDNADVGNICHHGELGTAAGSSSANEEGGKQNQKPSKPKEPVAIDLRKFGIRDVTDLSISPEMGHSRDATYRQSFCALDCDTITATKNSSVLLSVSLLHAVAATHPGRLAVSKNTQCLSVLALDIARSTAVLTLQRTRLPSSIERLVVIPRVGSSTTTMMAMTRCEEEEGNKKKTKQNPRH